MIKQWEKEAEENPVMIFEEISLPEAYLSVLEGLCQREI